MVGDRVDYLTFNEQDGSEVWESIGRVSGFGTARGLSIVLVELHEPFWSKDHEFFVTILACAPDGLRLSFNTNTGPTL